MLAGDLQVKKMKKAPTYLIVGDSRVGKSSIFNYIRGLALKAVEKINKEGETEEDV
jgi:putative ribosome biogenesis GTPase RsgA